MSRSGYTDDCDDDLAAGRYIAALKSAKNGKRGQAFFRELLAALDAMPEKALIANELEADGEFCALGVLGHARGIDMSQLDPEDPDTIAKVFGIATSLAREVVYHNDEHFEDHEWIEVAGPPRQPWQRAVEVYMPKPKAAERRWRYMRDWVAKQIKEKNDA
jgi:hypothetical protein